MKTGQHPFWGSISPLSGLSGIGLLIMGSGRLAWAMIIAASLLWVYTLSVLVSVFLASNTFKKIVSREGETTVYTCIACFFSALFILLFFLLCPLAALEIFFLLSLVPLYCVGSGVFQRVIPAGEDNSPDPGDAVFNAAAEAAVLAVLLIIISIIREPISYCSLTLPGSYQGIITIFTFNEGLFFPIRIFASSGGSLLLLGYIAGLYHYCRSVYYPMEEKI
ncbi:MAG: hypothetical protein FWG99_01435 [Treponema sp.]|nr:hypothetical protein [Treponema sp.]